MAHLIQQNHDGSPVYFHPKAGLAAGHPSGGWVERPRDALAFARASDAQAYIEAHMPHLQVVVSTVEKEVQ